MSQFPDDDKPLVHFYVFETGLTMCGLSVYVKGKMSIYLAEVNCPACLRDLTDRKETNA